MITTGGRLWFGVAALALVAAVAYNVASGEEWFGTFVLGSLMLTAALLGFMAVALRDGDVAAGEAVDAPVRRSLPAGWPALAAVGAGTLAVGLADGGSALLYVGLGILGATTAEWMVQSWAERATADPAYNQALRNRIMFPVEIPALAVVVIAVFLLSLSRLLLALPKTGSTVAAIAIGMVILLLATLIASRPHVGPSVIGGVLAVGAVALIAAGITSAVTGERDIEKHETHGSESLHNTSTTAPYVTTTLAP